MREFIKKLIPKKIRAAYRQKQTNKRKKIKYNNWLANGKPAPPPHLVKELTIAKFAKNHQIKIFVESGTHKGEMIRSQLCNFKEIHSIELNQALYNFNIKQFDKFPNVHLYLGDSSLVLPKILLHLNDKAIFWLDGHFDFTSETSKGELVTPIRSELLDISKSNFHHVVIIDDARLFNGINDYPTIVELKDIIESAMPESSMIIKNDMIIIEKKK